MLGRHYFGLALTLLLAMAPACARPRASTSVHILSLQNRADPEEVHRFVCPNGECVSMTLDQPVRDLRCPPFPIDTLVVTGHSDCPRSFLGQPPEIIAQALHCGQVGLVVLDTCRGFCAPLIEAFLDAWGPQSMPPPVIVGALDDVPPKGLRYGAAFFAPGPAEERARHVATYSGAPLVRWQLNGKEMIDAQAEILRMGSTELEANVVSLHPNLVRAPLDSRSQEILIAVPSYRFRP